MAGEFKIKTGLLLGAPASTQPVTSIKDTSISITEDASSILVTGKAIYDFHVANTAGGVAWGDITGSLSAQTDLYTPWLVDLSTKITSATWGSIGGDISNQTDLYTPWLVDLSTKITSATWGSITGSLSSQADLYSPWLVDLSTRMTTTSAFWQLDGSILSPIDETVNVQLSAIQIATDAGTVSVIDMDVSSATAGTEESYAFNIDGTQIAKVYAEGNGAAGIQEPAFKVLEALYAESSVYFSAIPESSTSYLVFYDPTSDEITYANQSSISGTTQLSALTDVSIGGVGAAQDGSILVYNNTGGYWSYSSIDTEITWGEIGGTLSNQTDLYTPWLVDMSTNISGKYDKTGGTISGPVTISTGGLALTNGDVSISNGNLDVNGDVAISGSLTVDGSIYSVGIEEIDVSAAFINLNTGLVGSPPEWMQSGIVIHRGSDDPYAIIFDESQETFRIGVSPKDGSLFDDASTQAVATREDSPISAGVAYWNDTLFRMDTDVDLRYSGGNLLVNNDISVGDQIFAPNLTAGSQPALVFWNDSTGEFTQADASTLGYDASTFLSLQDTPNAYTDGSAGSAVVINDAGTGLEFAPRIWREESNEVTLANENADVLFYENIEIEPDSGVGTFVDKSVTASSAIGTDESYTFDMDGNIIAKIYAQSDGAGSIREQKFVSVATFQAESSVYFTGIPDVSTSYVLFYDPTSDEVTYASQGSISGVTALSALTDVSIGGTIPDGSSLVYNSAGSYWTYGAGGGGGGDYWTLDGSTLSPTDSTVDVKLSSIEVDEDGGVVSLVDMSVTSTPAADTEESYSFDIDGSTVAKVYGKADGAGTLSETGFVVETVQYMGDPNTNGSWRFYPDSNGDLVFEKRISGTWTEKGKFTE